MRLKSFGESKRGKAAACIMLVTTMAGCSFIPGTEAYKIAQAEQKVAALMKDPTSALFTDVRLSPDKYVCGFVNAKNSFGAYEGKEGFLVAEGGSAELGSASNSNNPGIVASSQCSFEAKHSACIRGEHVLTASVASTRQCSAEGLKAVDEAYKIKLKALGG